MEKILGIKQSAVPVLKTAVRDVQYLMKKFGPSSSSFSAEEQRCFSPYPYPYGRDHGYGYMIEHSEDTFSFTVAEGHIQGFAPKKTEETTFKVAYTKNQKKEYLIAYRIDRNELGIIPIEEDSDFFENDDLFFMSKDEEDICTESASYEDKVHLENIRLLYHFRLNEEQMFDLIMRTEGGVIIPDIFQLRLEKDPEGVISLYVFLPKETVGFYGADNTTYKASDTCIWDGKEEWIKLPMTSGEVYAYIEKDEDGEILEGTSIQFSATEMTEDICVKIGEIIEDHAVNMFLGPYCLGGTSTPLIYPWRTIVGQDGNVSVTLGRVYELDTLKSSEETNDFDYCFKELMHNDYIDGVQYFPKYTWTVNPMATWELADDYISIVIDRESSTGELKDKYKLGFESKLNITSSTVLIKRIAKYTYSGGKHTIEQIHMGDITLSQRMISAFCLARQGTSILMYLPAKSVVINGVDYTSSSGLGDGAMTNWKVVSGYATEGLNLYITMEGDASGLYGKVASATFSSTAPENPIGEVRILKILEATASAGLVSVVNSAIDIEIIRTDSGTSTTTSGNSKLRSISKRGNGEHTLQIFGFENVPSLVGTIHNTEDDYTQHLIVREYDSVSTTARVAYLNLDTLIDSITQEIEDYFEENPPSSSTDYSDFFYWYDNLTDEDKKFWERGADESINYGSAIGNSSQTKVIDLDCTTLKGCWSAELDLYVGCLLGASAVVTCCLCIPVDQAFYYAGKEIQLCGGFLKYNV